MTTPSGTEHQRSHRISVTHSIACIATTLSFVTVNEKPKSRTNSSPHSRCPTSDIGFQSRIRSCPCSCRNVSERLNAQSSRIAYSPTGQTSQ